ncbi:hypothetical protein [Nonomuraea indica]|uniref:Excreted virulence factor EspC, type VII ESX diderm n=1 Tax=Nonomuraea indica TaxID=1581193 RepID=A0ABW8AGC4_9ACTN
MAQEIHITSTAIAGIQRNLQDYLIPELRQLNEKVDSTDVPFPGFGTLGLLMAAFYGTVQDDVKRNVDDACETIELWITDLETIKKNWREAELNSTVVYR